MKITKSQLKQLIKEEREKLLNEQTISQGLIEDLNNALDAIYGATTRIEEADDTPAEELASDIIMQEVEAFLDSIGMRGKHGFNY